MNFFNDFFYHKNSNYGWLHAKNTSLHLYLKIKSYFLFKNFNQKVSKSHLSEELFHFSIIISTHIRVDLKLVE